MTEMEQLELNDVYVNFAMAMQQYGARRVLEDLQNSYPLLFKEMLVQLPRVGNRPVAALLRK